MDMNRFFPDGGGTGGGTVHAPAGRNERKCREERYSVAVLRIVTMRFWASSRASIAFWSLTLSERIQL